MNYYNLNIDIIEKRIGLYFVLWNTKNSFQFLTSAAKIWNIDIYITKGCTSLSLPPSLLRTVSLSLTHATHATQARTHNVMLCRRWGEINASKYSRVNSTRLSLSRDNVQNLFPPLTIYRLKSRLRIDLTGFSNLPTPGLFNAHNRFPEMFTQRIPAI